MGTRRVTTVTVFVAAALALLLAPGTADAQQERGPATAAAERFAQALLTHARDRYGPRQTPLFVQMLELDTLKIPATFENGAWRTRTSGEWREVMKDWRDDAQYTYWGKWFSNVGIADTAAPSSDLTALEGLYELSEATGDPRYKAAADAYLRFFLAHMVNKRTGLWGWGFHMSWNLLDDTLRGNRHELERVIPPWDRLRSMDASAVKSEIEGLYRHVKDRRTFAFDRHAHFLDDAPESETNGYNEYALRYIHAWTYLYARTGDARYRSWARRMLLSRRSKTADRTDVFPYLWNPDLDEPIGLGWQNSLKVAYYLLDAYRLRPDPWLLDPAMQMLDRFQGGAMVNWGGETFGVDGGARAVALGYEITRDPALSAKMLSAAEGLLKATPPTVQMAQGVGQSLHFMLDVYEATGDPRWWEAVQQHVTASAARFQHPSGLIRGTVGLQRPDYYDASQGSGDLFAAWARAAYLARHPALVGWDFPRSVPPGARSVLIRARVHRAEQLPEVALLYRQGETGPERRVHGTVTGGVAAFRLPAPAGWGGTLVWRGEVTRPYRRRTGLFRITVSADTTPPRIGTPSYPTTMANDGPIEVRVPVSDAAGLQRAALHYAFDDRIGFTDALERPVSGVLRFRIRNDPRFEGKIAFCVEAVDASPARNTALSPWRSLRCYTRVRSVVSPLAPAAGAADLRLRVAVRRPMPLTIERTPWAPPGASAGTRGLERFYRVHAPAWATDVTAASAEIAIPASRLVGVVASTLHLARWTGGAWMPAPSRLDLRRRVVITRALSPGWWKLEATPRAKWTHAVMHGETAAPTLADLDADGRMEAISAMGGGPPWGAILNPNGTERARLDVGERVRQSGNYSGVAVLDLDGDGTQEILIGSADTHLYCFDAAGRRKWRTATDGLVRGGVAVLDKPAANGARIFAASDSGTVFAFATSGAVVWSRHLGVNTAGTPVVAPLPAGGDQVLYVTRDPGRLWSLDLDGRVLWTAPLDGRPCDPAVGDLDGDGADEIVVGATPATADAPDQGAVSVFDLQGRLVRAFPVRGQSTDSRGINSVAMADLDADKRREIVVECGDGGVRCFSPAGAERWRFMTRANVNGFPAFADLDSDGKTDVVVGSNDWHIYALRGDGALIWDHKGVWMNSFASVADIDRDGWLEVIYNSPRIPGLTCLRTEGKAGSGPAPWPTMRGNLRRTGCY